MKYLYTVEQFLLKCNPQPFNIKLLGDTAVYGREPIS